MPSRSLFWRLFPWLALTALGALAVAGVHGYGVLRDTVRGSVFAHLESEARLAAHSAVPFLPGDPDNALQEMARSLSQGTDTRLTYIAPDGEVLGDSEAFPASMDNHVHRPEIRKALQGGVGRSERYSATRQQTLMYVALPIERDGVLLGVSRTSKPVDALGRVLSYVKRQLAMGVVLVGALAALVTWLLTRHILKPMQQLRQAAEGLKDGAFDVDLMIEGSQEVETLAASMRAMRDTIYEKLQTIEKQRSELELILTDLGDGVLALDGESRIVLINRAACQQLGVNDECARGRSVFEVIRRSAVLELVRRVMEQENAVREELTLRGDMDLILDAHATRVRTESGELSGALIVLRDMTPFRQMKQTMQKFAENASHELRTPITSIKGFLETVLDSPDEDPEILQRFIRKSYIAAAHLEALINDLLMLSRLERDAGKEAVKLTPHPVAEVVKSAMGSCAASCEGREIIVDAEEDLVVAMRRPLLEQAVLNLLDNACKYSPDGTPIQLSAFRQEESVIIEVRDQGTGIPPQHLPFLFNRFYRVDESRSRALGGTGLGLAIVKHVVNLHHGEVSVESQEGRGSTFRIELPEYVS